ncbi:MAG: MoaD/ThiS family protein [Trueperaceae bacterium]
MDRKSVTLDYFAIFREFRKRDQELVSTSARDAGELYQELKARHGFPLPVETLRVAINDEFAPWEREIREGDRVTFIAPVAGG